MTISRFNPRNVILLSMIFVAAGMRLATNFSSEFGPLALFTPIGAMAIFGGAYFRGNIKPLMFPLLTLFISDLILSFTVLSQFRTILLYDGWYWTYGAFALMTIAGKLIIKKVAIHTVLLAAIVSTTIHWLVSDIGGCIQDTSGAGFLTVYGQRLISALPYEFRFFAGTIIYSGILFGAFEWLQRRYPKLQMA